MPRPALRVHVSKKDQAALKKVLAGGIAQVRVAMRAVALLRLGEGMSAPRIAEVLPLTRQPVRNLARRYQQGGLERALYDKQRPGAASLLSAKQRQRIIAMVCGDPPRGRARWTGRLVAEEAVQRRLVPRVDRETIRILLLSHDLKPWRKKCGACRNSMKRTSPVSKTCSKPTNGRTIRRNRWFVWMRSR